MTKEISSIQFTQDPRSIPQKGNSFAVPRPAFLVYWEDTLRVVLGDRIVRQITGIQRLIFWTGFNGTRTFVGNARVPQDEIFGGGKSLSKLAHSS